MTSHKQDSTRRRLGLAALALAAAAGRPAVAPADVFTWAAPTDGFWSTGFTPGTPPSSFATQLALTPGNYTSTNDLGAFNLNALTVNNADGNTINVAGFNALTFGGTAPALSLTGGSTNIVGQIVTSDGTQIVNSGGGTLTLNSMAFASNGATGITNSGAGNVVVTDSYNNGPAFFGTNALINLANTGAGTLSIGNIGPSTGFLGTGVGGTVNVSAGAVTFAGNTAGDLFGNALVLNVAAGASFNFANNAEGFGGISGAGTIIEGTAGLTLNEPGNRTFSGTITGTGGLTQNAPGTLTIGAANALSPNAVLTIANGTVALSGFSQTIAGLAGGNTTGSLALGGSTLTINPASGTSYTYGVGLTGPGNLVIGGAGTENLLGNNTYVGTTNVGSGTLRLNVGGLVGSGGTATTAAGATLIAVAPADASAGSYFNGAGNFAKEGTGNLTFSTTNPNFAAAGVTVAAGTLTLDQTADAGAKLGVNVPLTLTSGTLSVVGNGVASSGATFGGLKLGGTGTTGGSGAIVATGATVNLGSITRAVGATVDFRPAATGTITTTATATNGILGGYATFNRADFATVTGGTVAALGSYDATFASNTSNVSLAASATLPGSTTANSLRLTAPAAVTFAASGTLTLSSGGVLVTPSVTDVTSIGTTTTRGTLTAPAAAGVIVHQYGAAPLTINSVISGSGGLTKAGDGTLTLTATNTYTGGTYLNGGTLLLPAAIATNLGAASSPLYINGGTLSIPAGSLTFNSSTHSTTIGPAGATLNFGAAETFQGSGLTGTGTLTKTGAGQLSVGSNASAFTGAIVINAGSLRETSSQLTKATGLTLAAGTAFQITDDATANFGIAPGAPVVFGGAGPTGSTTPGALVLTDQSPTGAAGIAPNTTFTNPFTFLADTTIGTYNGSSTRTAQLTLPNPITGTGNLIKVGNGNLVLASPNNAFGNGGAGVVIANGTVQLGVDNGVPAASVLQLGQTGATTSGTFDLAGFNQAVAGFSTAGSGTANVVINSVATTASVLTVNAAAGTGRTFAGSLGGSSPNFSLVKAGTGTLTLTGSNTFTGTATVAAGSLRVAGGSINAPRPYAVNDGGNLIVTTTDSSPLTATTLALGNTGASNLSFELNGGTPGGSGAVVVTTPDGLTVNGSVSVSVGSTAGLSVGSFPLISYAGTLQGGGFAAFSPTLSLQSRAIGSLVNDTANHTIDLDITGVDFLRYTGAVNGNFDVNATANFKLNSNGAATTYLDQPSPDSVTFDDSATGTHTVNLTTVLHPAAITVNATSDYTFTGTGSLAGTTGVIKAGAGALTLLTNNTYAGTTTINGGAIVVGSGGTAGSLGTGAVLDNGSLTVNRSDAVTVAGNITGTGSVATAGGGTTTLAGTNAIGGNLTATGGSFAVTGTTAVGGAISGNPIAVSGGLQVGGTLAADVALSGGGTLTFNNSAGVTDANAITGNGNLAVANGSVLLTGNVNYSGLTTVPANTTLEYGSALNTSIGNAISGTGTIVKSGAGTLALLGSSNGFTGTLIVNAGTAQLDDQGAGGDLGTASIVVTSGGTFTFGPDNNPDLPDTTIVTVNAGGTFNLMTGENYGGIVLNGGTYVGGNGTTAENTTAVSGYTFNSGSVTTNGTGGGQLAGMVNLDKYTDGTVTFSGAATIGTGVTVNVHQGTLAFGGANFPAAGTAPITLGDNGTVGTLVLIDAKAASTVRPIVLQDNGGAFNIASAAGSLTIQTAITGSAPLTLTGAGTLTFNASNSYTGDTTINGGTLVLTANGAVPGNITLNAGALRYSAAPAPGINKSAGILARTTGTLTVNAGASASIDPALGQAGRTVLVATGLAVGGRLDVSNNDVVVRGGSLSALTAAAASGFAGGTWNGSAGLVSSTAAADGAHLTALGVIVAGSTYTTFDGQSVSAGDVLARYTYYGDANLDGSVSAADYTIVDAGYLLGRTVWANGDFNYDGVVDGSDYSLMDNAFNQQPALVAAPTAMFASAADLVASPAAAVSTSAVPEPTTLAVLGGVAMAAQLGRRRRR